MQYNDIKTTSDYCAYVKDTAETIVENAIERLKEDDMPVNADNISVCIAENCLEHEAIDGDAIIIYYFGHSIILQHTDNENYGAEVCGWESMQADSWQGIKQNVAYWAFMGDVQDVLGEAITKGANQFTKGNQYTTLDALNRVDNDCEGSFPNATSKQLYRGAE